MRAAASDWVRPSSATRPVHRALLCRTPARRKLHGHSVLRPTAGGGPHKSEKEDLNTELEHVGFLHDAEELVLVDLAVAVTVSGEIGATVQLTIDGDDRFWSAVIGDSGRATLSFNPTLLQVLRGVDVSIAYRLGDEVGPPLLLHFAL